jgi:zinc and cadmium transporter
MYYQQAGLFFDCLSSMGGGTYLLLIRAGFSKKLSFFLAFLAAALTTPMGMLLSYPYISQIDKPFLGALLSFSAGALVYVGATHLLPQAEAERKKYSLFALGAGIIVTFIIVISKGQTDF